MGIKEGNIISLSKDAVYYSGKVMPDWVKNDQWIVRSVTGDRAILGKNVSGSNDINSPVNIKYLNVLSHEQQNNAAVSATQKSSVKAAQTVQNATVSQKNVANTQKATASGEMSVSDRCV